jgi:hypothetical protein
MALTLDGMIRALRARAHGLADACEAGESAVDPSPERADRSKLAGRRAVLEDERHERRD